MKENSKKHFYIPFFVLATVLLLSTLFFLAFGIISQKKEDVPFDIVVANITTSSAEVYWKTKKSLPQVLSYKEKSSTAPYKTKDHITPLSDNLTSSNVYIQKVENLHPNETYIFKIKSGNTVIEKDLTFETLPISDKLVLPTIEVGEGPKGTLILISTESNKYMVDTKNHGTWTFDSKGEKYSTSNYANYTPQEILGNALDSYVASKSIYGIQKAYATEESSAEDSPANQPANCFTNVKITKPINLPPNKSVVQDLIGRWVYKENSPIGDNGCPGGNYSGICYEDIYCRAIEHNIDPGVVFTIWANESAGSNYARFIKKQELGHYGKDAHLADFGIEFYEQKVPYFDFNTQLDWFLENNTGMGYISNCALDSGYSYLEIWGIKYRDGTQHCKTKEALEARLNSSAGSYGKYIAGIYRLFTNGELVFPFTLPMKTEAPCDRSKQEINTRKMVCQDDWQPSGYIPNPPPLRPIKLGKVGDYSTTPPPELQGKPASHTTDLGIGQLVVTTETRYCAEEGGCRCIYQDGEKIIYVKNGWNCTPDQQTNPTKNICCQVPDQGMWMVPEYNCTGHNVIREDIQKGECYSDAISYSLSTGNNFIQLQEVHNTADIPLRTAQDLIDLGNGSIMSISTLENGLWTGLVLNENGKTYGNDFNLESGKSYFIVVPQDLELKTLGTQIAFSPDKIPTEEGWALVGKSAFPPGTTTHEILNNSAYKNVQQIAIWSTDKNKLEYTSKDNEGIIGQDTYLSDNTAVFVRIK